MPTRYKGSPLLYICGTILTMADKSTLARARFREALQAVHVLPEGGGWTVMQAGHEPKTFPDRDAAVQEAERFAALRHVGVLVHESQGGTRTE
jgi:hypothetical protein